MSNAFDKLFRTFSYAAAAIVADYSYLKAAG